MTRFIELSGLKRPSRIAAGGGPEMLSRGGIFNIVPFFRKVNMKKGIVFHIYRLW
jgi:hypothetical protein